MAELPLPEWASKIWADNQVLIEDSFVYSKNDRTNQVCVIFYLRDVLIVDLLHFFISCTIEDALMNIAKVTKHPERHEDPLICGKKMSLVTYLWLKQKGLITDVPDHLELEIP